MGWAIYRKNRSIVSGMYARSLARPYHWIYRMHAFNQSLRYDQRMHSVDIKGSIAYARALALKQILTSDERDKMISGLLAVEKEWVNGTVGSASCPAT